MANQSKPLKLLVLAYDYRPKLGGVASATFELAKALAQKPGVELRMLAPQESGDVLFDTHGIFPTQRVKVPRNDFLSIFTFTFWIVVQLWRWRPQAILSSLWLPCGVSAWLLYPILKILRIKLFNVVHGVEICESERTFRKRLRKRFKWIKKSVMLCSSRIFSVSNFTAEYLSKDCQIRKKKIKVIFNGIDRKIFFPEKPAIELQRKYRIEGKIVFLTVSRLEDYKGVDYILSALSAVNKSNNNWIYLIGGTGPDLDRLKSLTILYKLEDKVHFLGKVETILLNNLFNLCDVFILNSRDDWEAPNFEGFGIVLIEAAACGKPAIAGRSGGIPEVVEDNESGWLVPPFDTAAIASRILLLLEDPELIRQCGKTAYQNVIKRFQWTQVADTVLVEIQKSVWN